MGAIIAIPLFIVVLSGILLQVKKQVPWVQPTEQKGMAKIPGVSFDQLLLVAVSQPELKVTSWSDVHRIDYKPSGGVVKIISKSGFEAQVDAQSGKVLQVAERRSDWIESLHDGSFFLGDWSKLGIFLPSGVALFFLILTGIYLFWLPIIARKRKKKQFQAHAAKKQSPSAD